MGTLECNVTIRIKRENHPGCWGKDCEEDHKVEYAYITSGEVTRAFNQGSPEWALLRKILMYLDNEKSTGIDVIEMRDECTCGLEMNINHVVSMKKQTVTTQKRMNKVCQNCDSEENKGKFVTCDDCSDGTMTYKQKDL